MLQSHDAGTGYLDPFSSGFIDDIVYRFTRTQVGGIYQQLDCGSRAFDWRPSLGAAGLGFAHGAIYVNHSMQAAAADVVRWANEHSHDQEDALVILNVADCNGQSCINETVAAFAAVGLPVVSGGGCSLASDWTLGAAMDAAALPGGGHAVALVNCPQAPVNTYDDRCSCTGFDNIPDGEEFEADLSKCLSIPSPPELVACIQGLALLLNKPSHFACYADASGQNQSLAFSRLLDFNVQVAAVPPPSGPGQRGLLFSLQGCWAQNVQSTVMSFLHNSSLIDDDVRSNFNHVLVDWLKPGDASTPALLEYVNLVGVNNACDNGPQLVQVLRERLAALEKAEAAKQVPL